MSTRTTSALRIAPGGVDWRRAEFVLTGLAFLGFLSAGIQIKTIYSGLPAHPLFVHVPVVLIPVSLIAGLAALARPEWLGRYGIAFSACSIVAMSSIFPARQAGEALVPALHLHGQAAQLISQHQAASNVLTVAFVLFTACLILTFSAYRISGGRPTGLGIADTLLGSKTIYLLLRIALVVLALVSAYYVFRVGDLGAKAVWLGRLHSS